MPTHCSPSRTRSGGAPRLFLLLLVALSVGCSSASSPVGSDAQRTDSDGGVAGVGADGSTPVEPGTAARGDAGGRAEGSDAAPSNSAAPSDASTDGWTGSQGDSASASPTSTCSTTQTIVCASTAEIQAAMQAAKPGDVIVIKAGTYLGVKHQVPGTTWYPYFGSDRSGTASCPIVLESESPSAPAVLTGEGPAVSGYGLHLSGDYWQVRNVVVRSASKGILLEHSNHSVIYGSEVFDIGDEGIHLRSGSSFCRVERTWVHDTGVSSPGFGEGIYVGSDKGKWSEFSKDANDNVISGCRLGPNVRAEHVDVKEGTLRTVVEGCEFDGAGIAGDNSADSFVDAKGNDAIIRGNRGRRNGNTAIVAAFQVHQQVSGWGTGSTFERNAVDLDDASAYVLTVQAGGSATARDNVRTPAGNMYSGPVAP